MLWAGGLSRPGEIMRRWTFSGASGGGGPGGGAIDGLSWGRIVVGGACAGREGRQAHAAGAGPSDFGGLSGIAAMRHNMAAKGNHADGPRW